MEKIKETIGQVIVFAICFGLFWLFLGWIIPNGKDSPRGMYQEEMEGTETPYMGGA